MSPLRWSCKRWQSTPPKPSSSAGWSYYLNRAWHVYKANFFTISLPFVATLSMMYPDTMRTHGKLEMQQYKDRLIAGIFYFSGVGLLLSQALSAVKSVKAHAVCQGLVFGIAPIFYFLSAFLLAQVGLPESVVQGWLLMGALPTSIGTSIALTRIGAGDTAIALLNSLMSNLGGVFVTPFLIAGIFSMWGSVRSALGIEGNSSFKGEALDAGKIVGGLVSLVVIPVFIGVACRQAFPALGQLAFMQNVCLLTVLSTVFSDAAYVAPTLLSTQQLLFLVGVVAAGQFSMVAISWGFAGRKILGLTREARIAATMIGSQKTAAMGVPLVMMMFSHDPAMAALASLPIVLNNPLQSMVGGMFATWSRRLH